MDFIVTIASSQSVANSQNHSSGCHQKKYSQQLYLQCGTLLKNLGGATQSVNG